MPLHCTERPRKISDSVALIMITLPMWLLRVPTLAYSTRSGNAKFSNVLFPQLGSSACCVRCCECSNEDLRQDGFGCSFVISIKIVFTFFDIHIYFSFLVQQKVYEAYSIKK